MWKIAQKDLKIFFSDKRAIILTLLLPVGLITLFAFAFGGAGGGDKKTATPPVTLLYADEDISALSHALVNSLDSIEGVNMEVTEAARGTSAIKNGSNVACIIIRKGFEDSIQQGGALPLELIYDESRAMETGILQNVVVGIIRQMKGKLDASANVHNMLNNMMPYASQASRDSLQVQIEKNMTQGKPETSPLVQMVSITGSEPENWGLIQAVAGTAIMMLLFSVSAIGAAIIQEKEDGVLRKLLQTPINPTDILFGKMISASVISLFQLTVMFLYAWIAFGLNLFQNIPALIIMIFFTAVACATFGVFLASVATSKRQVDALRTIVILFMSAIGGSMIPLYIMPEFMQHIAKVSVNYWGIQGFYDIFWRKLSIGAIADNVAALSLISLIMISISVYFFRRNIMRIV